MSTSCINMVFIYNLLLNMVTFQISYKVYRSFSKATLWINMLYIWNPFTEHGNISNII